MYQMNMMQQLNNCFFNTCCTIMTFIRYFNWYSNDSNVVPKNTGINLCDFHQLFKYLVYSYIYVEIYPVTHLQLHNTFTSTSFTVIFSVRWYFPRYLVHSHNFHRFHRCDTFVIFPSLYQKVFHKLTMTILDGTNLLLYGAITGT